MNEINKEFYIPYYIFEEIVEYVELRKQGYCKTMKWENIKALLRLAQVNNRLELYWENILKLIIKRLMLILVLGTSP